MKSFDYHIIFNMCSSSYSYLVLKYTAHCSVQVGYNEFVIVSLADANVQTPHYFMS